MISKRGPIILALIESITDLGNVGQRVGCRSDCGNPVAG